MRGFRLPCTFWILRGGEARGMRMVASAFRLGALEFGGYWFGCLELVRTRVSHVLHRRLRVGVGRWAYALETGIVIVHGQLELA